MKGKNFAHATALLMAVAFLMPAVGAASTISWTLSGTLNNVQGPNPLGVGLGTPFTLTVSYDSAASAINNCAAGDGGSPDNVTNCVRVYDPSSVRFTLDLGTDCDPAAGYQPCSSGAVNTSVGFLRVYNNFKQASAGIPDPIDGINFRIYEQDSYDSTHVQRWTLFMPTSNLDALGGLGLPTSTAGFDYFNFGVCTAVVATGVCDTNFTTYWRVDDTNGSIPEPGSLALLGVGLAALVNIRRRRH